MNWYLKCLGQYADFSGRARRKEYWMFVLFNCIFSFVFGFIDGLLGWTNAVMGFGVIGGAYALVVLVPGFAVAVRRLHDIGKSGWNFFFVFIPLVGAIMLLIWFCTEGEYRINEWGPNPKMVDV